MKVTGSASCKNVTEEWLQLQCPVGQPGNGSLLELVDQWYRCLVGSAGPGKQGVSVEMLKGSDGSHNSQIEF